MLRDLAPTTNEDKAVKRVESAEMEVMDKLHEFGQEWLVSGDLGPLERRALKRGYSREIWDIIVSFIERETAELASVPTPNSETPTGERGTQTNKLNQ